MYKKTTQDKLQDKMNWMVLVGRPIPKSWLFCLFEPEIKKIIQHNVVKNKRQEREKFGSEISAKYIEIINKRLSLIQLAGNNNETKNNREGRSLSLNE